MTSFIPTLNQKGFATTSLDKYSLEFVKYARECRAPVLEIGAGYGTATLAALSGGAAVVCNDLEPKHLQIIEQHVQPADRSRLTLISGSFPHELKFSGCYFSAILISRVLHFFDGVTIKQSLQNIHQWLKPQGKVFIIADTPYMKNLSSFIPEYETRIERGETWPGLIIDVTEYIHDEMTELLPKMVHPLDTTVLKRELTAQQFLIDKIELFARPDYPADRRLDGRECVGAVATKQ